MTTKQDIRRAIDQNLANVQVTDAHVQRVLARAHGDERARAAQRAPRRLRWALIPALIVLLILMLLFAITGVADISLRDYYERLIQIEALEGEAAINDWSLEHKLEMIDLMQKRVGVEIDGAKLKRLRDKSLPEEERDALAMEIILDRYRRYEFDDLVGTMEVMNRELCGNWSLEDAAWFSEQLNRYIYKDYVGGCLVPGEGDLPFFDALEIAYAYYEDNYGLTVADFEDAPVSFGFEESVWDDGGEKYNGELLRSWGFTFAIKGDTYNGQELASNWVSISVLDDGTVGQATEPDVRDWENDWEDFRLSDEFMTVEGMYHFAQVWPARVAELLGDCVDVYNRPLKYLVTKDFCLPEPGDLTRDEAYAAACAGLTDYMGWDAEMLKYYGTFECCLNEGGVRQYRFGFSVTKADREHWDAAFDLALEGEIPNLIRVSVDAQTGEVLEAYVEEDWDVSWKHFGI